LSVPKARQLEAATQANVRNQVRALAAVPLLGERVRAGALKIVGAEYRLHTGEVELLS
jgi:carbonic anhydrase